MANKWKLLQWHYDLHVKIVIKSFLIIDSNLKIDLIIDSIAPKQYVNEVQKCFKKTEKKNIIEVFLLYRPNIEHNIYTNIHTSRHQKAKTKIYFKKIEFKIKMVATKPKIDLTNTLKGPYYIIKILSRWI